MSENSPPAVSFREALSFWFKLGCISFGGPAGQIAIMHSELVEQRRWISDRRFLHALNFCMVLPGPEAQQLATYIGWLLHGTKGGVAAGLLFIVPSLVLLMALSAIYVAWGELSVVAAALDGIKPTVVALVLAALIRIGGRTIKNEVMLGFAVASFLAVAILRLPFPAIVLAAGFLGWVGGRLWSVKFQTNGHGGKEQVTEHHPSVIDDDQLPPAHAEFRWSRLLLQIGTSLLLWFLPTGFLVATLGWQSTFTQMAWFFTTAALVTFGGAYAVLPYVAEQSVEVYRWLRPGQMIDGLALGETTPGPLIMVVSFVGFLGGWQVGEASWLGAVGGCLIATYFTFLPSFVFILIGAPFIEKLRGEVDVTAPLTGITAAVVGVIFNLLLYFSKAVFMPVQKDGESFSLETWANFWSSIDYFALAIAVAAFVALFRYRANIAWVVVATAILGLLRYGVTGH